MKFRKLTAALFVTGVMLSSTANASFATSCHDPRYSWWEYSGIEALTCLFSGQW